MTEIRENSFLRLQFGSRYAVSWPVMFLYAVPSFWVTLLYDLPRLGGSQPAWFLVALVSYAATLIPLVIARYSYLNPSKNQRSKPLATFLTYLLASATRVSSILFVGISLEIVPEQEIAYRTLSAPVHVVVWFTLITALVTARLNHKARMATISNQASALKLSSEVLDATMKEDSNTALARILAALEPSLQQIQIGLKAGGTLEQARLLQSNLRVAIEDVVRPLARQLADPGLLISEVKHVKHRKRKAIRASVRDLNDFQLISSIAAFAISVPIIHEYGFQVFVSVAIPTLFITWLFGWGVNRIAGRKELPIWLVLLLLSAWYSLSSALAVSLFGGQNELIPASLNAQYVGLVLLSVIAVAAFRVALLGQADLEEVASSEKERLAFLEAALRQQLWVSRNDLATTLHGPVQAAFQVAAMKLGSVTEVSESLVAEIRATIDEALVELSAPIMVNHEIFENTCKDIVEVWAGVMSVSIQISSECHSAFDEFSGTAKCVLALIRDAVANASKHGFATSTEVNVSIADNCVMLEVRNNGKSVPVPVQPGFGFQMLEEVSLQWSLSSNDRATVITALIPLA